VHDKDKLGHETIASYKSRRTFEGSIPIVLCIYPSMNARLCTYLSVKRGLISYNYCGTL